MPRIKRKAPKQTPQEPVVNKFAARHGDYQTTTVVDLNNELGGGRQRMARVVLNRGGSAIERWLAEPNSKLFGPSEIEAVRHCQRLWARIDYHSSIIVGIGIASTVEGQGEQDALDELAEYQAKLPPPYWRTFENICRFETETGEAGSHLANNSRTSVEAAKLATAFCASMIAQWRGL